MSNMADEHQQHPVQPRESFNGDEVAYGLYFYKCNNVSLVRTEQYENRVSVHGECFKTQKLYTK